ncbi:MAG: TlpA family protein disulfide reductase [Desulfovibrionales bacterium]
MKSFILALVLISMLGTAHAAQPGSYPEAGDPFPNLPLQGDISSAQQEFLGLQAEETRDLASIDADAVLIEFFSMYCPFCQSEAPDVNALFEMVESETFCRDLKMIGIGVGNTQFEVDFFQNKYEVPFPLFTDQDFIVIDQVGQVGTPYFVLVELSDQGEHQTLLSNMGPFDSPETFLKEVRSALCPDDPGK